jgi:hypothetical protein
VTHIGFVVTTCVTSWSPKWSSLSLSFGCLFYSKAFRRALNLTLNPNPRTRHPNGVNPSALMGLLFCSRKSESIRSNRTSFPFKRKDEFSQTNRTYFPFKKGVNPSALMGLLFHPKKFIRLFIWSFKIWRKRHKACGGNLWIALKRVAWKWV